METSDVCDEILQGMVEESLRGPEVQRMASSVSTVFSGSKGNHSGNFLSPFPVPLIILDSECVEAVEGPGPAQAAAGSRLLCMFRICCFVRKCPEFSNLKRLSSPERSEGWNPGAALLGGPGPWSALGQGCGL